MSFEPEVRFEVRFEVKFEFEFEFEFELMFDESACGAADKLCDDEPEFRRELVICRFSSSSQ